MAKKLRLSRRSKNYMLTILAIIIILTGFTLYSGVYPPASVVESYSMQHSDKWQFGIIDEGTIVFVKKINSVNDVKTYVTGKSDNYSTYGEYGNVILYHNSALGVITIHRAMFYLEWNHTKPVVKGYNGQHYIDIVGDLIILKDTGYAHRNFIVNVSRYVGHDGFITAGDNNVATLGKTSGFYNSKYNATCSSDQNIWGIEPVNLSKIVGKAYGYIPWFGLIKLNLLRMEGDWSTVYADHVPEYSYAGLIISIAAIVALIVFPYKKAYLKFKKK